MKEQSRRFLGNNPNFSPQTISEVAFQRWQTMCHLYKLLISMRLFFDKSRRAGAKSSDFGEKKWDPGQNKKF